MSDTSLKFLYKGTFNYHSIDITLWRYAVDKDKSFYLFCAEIARRSHTSVRRVINYFLGNERYIIQKMKTKRGERVVKKSTTAALSPIVI